MRPEDAFVTDLRSTPRAAAIHVRGPAQTTARLLAAALLLTGCERGCLSTWLSEHGAGGPPPPEKGGAPPTLEGTDCADGLLRCVDGHVEASKLAHLPSRCVAERSCSCPWEIVATCPCAYDGLEVAASPGDAGVAQLCRPRGSIARPVGPADAVETLVCGGESTTCTPSGVVVQCTGAGNASHALGVCLFGCQTAVTVENATAGEPANLDGLLSILCRRADAERQ